jgi:very-short-patch-repair endonuclease
MKKDQRYPLVLPLLRSLAPDAVAELKFHPTRKWSADFAIPSAKLLIEIEGGAWSGGRHTTGAGFVGDMEKYNAATCMGYRILRFQPADCKPKRITIIKAQVLQCLWDGGKL